MTNLVATIAFTITTNWWTTGTFFPNVSPSSGFFANSVYYPPIEHQAGNVMSNTVARFVWKGRTNEVVLESVVIQEGLTRQIEGSRFTFTPLSFNPVFTR